MVEPRRIELPPFALRTRRSPSGATAPRSAQLYPLGFAVNRANSGTTFWTGRILVAPETLMSPGRLRRPDSLCESVEPGAPIPPEDLQNEKGPAQGEPFIRLALPRGFEPLLPP